MPMLLSNKFSIYDGLWMMPEVNVNWCKKNEAKIIQHIVNDLNNNDQETSLKYIAGGEGFAKPHKCFPEKTAYYLGYKIIEKCINNEIPPEKVYQMSSQELIDISKVFELNID